MDHTSENSLNISRKFNPSNSNSKCRTLGELKILFKNAIISSGPILYLKGLKQNLISYGKERKKIVFLKVKKNTDRIFLRLT